MKIILSQQESEEMFHTALCNGLDYVAGGYGLNFKYNKSQYQAAKEKLAAEEKNSICFEDVLMEMLRMGFKLTLVDEEGDGAYTSEIGISEVHSRVQTAPINHLMAMANKTDDAETADVIIQTVFFNEIIFG